MIDLNIVPSALLVPVLEGNLRRLEKRHKVYDHLLQAVLLDLGADAAWLDRGRARGGERWVAGDESQCAFELSEAMIVEVTPDGQVPPNVLLQRVEVNGRLHGVLGAARAGGAFAIGQGRRLGRLAAVLGQDVERRHEERLVRVLDRIREKVVSALRPQDLAYQILDGLHQLVRYDHSAALLTWHAEAGLFRVAAEKIVWAKAKSAFIGHEVKGSPELLAALRGPSVVRRLSPGPSLDAGDRPLVEVLDYYRGRAIPEVRDLLCAPLFFDDEFLGMLKIADHRGRAFDDHDARVVERFLPAAAVSLRNVQVKQALEDQAMQAEIRAGLVTLARAVAHDVNNAIGAILPLAEQAREDLREGRVDPRALAQDLDLIIDKAALCKRIFSNMLRVAGKRSGSGPVDLRQIVEEMMPMFESQTAASGIKVELDIPQGLPYVRFSKHHLERVLWNLVTNAIEAMGRRQGQVRIEGRASGGGIVELAVVDDGPGIEADLLAKVVEPFFTTKPNGTGLGLSLVRSLVWQNDGDLDIASEPGHGTTVRLRLAADASLGVGRGLMEERARILVVDDDPGMRRAMERILAPLYDVESADGVTQALGRIGHDGGFHVALVDIRLGDGDGYSLCEEMRRSSPATDVILITGSTTQPDEKLYRSLEGGAFYFLFKPFERRVLRALVERCVRLQRERRAKEEFASTLAEDLSRARRFQHSLQPSGRLEAGGFRVQGSFEPCDAVGGDFWLGLLERDGSLVVAMADVVGHGVSAAMYAGMLRSTLEAARRADPDPARVQEALVAGVDFFEASRYATLFYGQLSASGRLRYWNAGHPPALLRRAGGGYARLGATGPPLSRVFEHRPRTVAEATLERGDRLLLFSDGASEARDPAERELSIEGLERALDGSSRGELAGALDALRRLVLDHVAGRPLEDDVTMVLVERGE